MTKLKAGFSRRCITPPLDTPMAGYFEERHSKGILDDLYINAVAIDDGEDKALIMSADLVGISTVISNQIRQVVSDYCNLPKEAIFLTCTHTHTGPVITRPDRNIVGSSEYETFLANQIRDCAKLAIGDLEDAEFSVGTSTVNNVGFIRRYRMKDGSVATNPGVGNSDILEMLGKQDNTVKLIKAERKSKDDIYFVSYGTHADTIGGEYISADWPGFVRSTLEKALEGVKCIFLTASEGDSNHINTNPTKGQQKGMTIDFDGVPRGYLHAQYMGRAVAGAVLQICDKTEPVNVGKIKYAGSVITAPSNQENDKLEEAEKIVRLCKEGRENELPYKDMALTTYIANASRIVKLKDGPLSYDFHLSAISFGDIAFTGFPGEPFVEIGRRIENESPFKMTLTCALANGGDSYFPTTTAYEEGGYEVVSSYLKKGVDEILVKGALKLLNEF